MKSIPLLWDKITQLNMLQQPFLAEVMKGLPPDELHELEQYIQYCLSIGLTLDDLAQAYDLFVKDTLAEQFFFRKNKRYRFSTYAEVASSVYLNDDYMRKYMHGLALTSFLWPNHVEIKRYFLKTIPRKARGRYLEIGPGHGCYFVAAMKHTQFDSFEGVDISPTSVEMTRSIVNSGAFGRFDKHEIRQCDFLAQDFSGKYDAIVMGEVLEHIETPGKFLEKIRTVANTGAYIFVTTCINSPEPDHIYLFRTVEEVEQLIRASGLAVREKLVLPYHGTSLEQAVKRELPINIACVLAAA